MNSLLIFISALLMAGLLDASEANLVDELDGRTETLPNETLIRLQNLLEKHKEETETVVQLQELIELNKIEYDKCNQDYLNKFYDLLVKYASSAEAITYIEHNRNTQYLMCEHQLVDQFQHQYYGGYSSPVFELFVAVRDYLDKQRANLPKVESDDGPGVLALVPSISDEDFSKALSNYLIPMTKCLGIPCRSKQARSESEIMKACRKLNQSLGPMLDLHDKLLWGRTPAPASKNVWEWTTEGRICRILLGERQTLVGAK